MRFFTGSRDKNTSGKKSASQLYKDRLNGKGKEPELSPTEKYQKMIEERMAKIMEDIMLGKKKNPTKLPGTKEDEAPKEVSKQTLLMVKMLAQKREQKERKLMKKKMLQEKWKESDKKWKENMAKNAELLKKQQMEDADKQSSSQSYFFGYSGDDDNKGW